MPETTIRKRETAHKLHLGTILKGNPVIEEIQGESGTPTREKFKFLEFSEDKKVVRVNVIANVIEKYISEGEKNWGSITIDDGTGQINIKVFGEDVAKFQELNQGDTLLIIGILRTYNQEVYILPEIIKKADPRYLLVRKLEIEKAPKLIPLASQPMQVQNSSTPSTPSTDQASKTSIPSEQSTAPVTPQVGGIREKIINLIKSGEADGGIDVEQLIIQLKDINPDEINKEITKLLEQGTIYEPRPGRVRYLG